MMPCLPRKLHIAALLLALVPAGCAERLDLIGIDNPQVPAASVAEAARHRIFVATTRAPSEAEGQLYAAERADRLGLAAVTVSLPPMHVAGVIERPESLPPDPRLEVAVTDPATFDGDRAFIAAIDRELKRRRPEDRSVLLFVHGYNNTLTDSVLRTAQFVEDSGFEGVPVLFSWASAARLSQYVYDLNSVLAARPQLEAASGILARTSAGRFDVFAHSMGALLVTEVMVRFDIAGSLGPSDRLGTIMLAAPDIDVDVFRSQLGPIERAGHALENVFVLLSKDDQALRASRRISGGIDRVGVASADELAGLGVTIIDLSEIQVPESQSHTKFASSPAVVRLIGNTLRQRGFANEPDGTAVLEIVDNVPVLRRLID